MARVVALVPDLLFGSRVQGSLTAAGHRVELVADAGLVRDRLRDLGEARGALVVDLTDEHLDGSSLVESLASEGALGGVGTLGFYSHVDGAARARAELAGFDLVVPRSRMAREGPALIDRLA
jgi:hypothetical protein